MFGPKVHPLHIPRGKVKTDGQGVYAQHQHVGHSNNDIATTENPLVVNKSHVYTVEIPASCFEDNARFIKDVKTEGDSLNSPSSETENFFLIFQLMAQVAYYAMRLSSSARYNSGDAEATDTPEETATAEQYFGQSEEENQVFAFIEGIPNDTDKKRDAMVRLWIIPQKNAVFSCDFPTLLAKVLAGEEFETKKSKSKGGFRNRVPYDSFSDNYKRLVGAHDKYLQAVYQTRYGRANIEERKKSEILNAKARESGHNTRGLGSPHNRHNIKYHFSVFPTQSNSGDGEPDASYWQMMTTNGGYMEDGDDYKIILSTLYANVDNKYFNVNNYFRMQNSKLIFCPKFREHMFQFLPSELGIRQTLVYSKTRANMKPRVLNRGPCSYLLPVRYVETILKPKQAQQELENEMKKLCLQERIVESSAEVLNTNKMGRYKVGTQSTNFIMPVGTTVHPHAENLLTFAAEEGLQEMLLRATVGPFLGKYAVTRNLIEHNPMLSNQSKLQKLHKHYVTFTNDNLKVFLQEINSKANISAPLLAVCQHIESETPEVSPFEFQRNPASAKHDFLATFMQSDLYEYEYFFCIAHNHKEFLLMIVIGLGSTRIDMMPLSLVVVGPGEGGKSWLQDNLRDSKVVGTTRNCNTSSNMAHTIGHSVNCLKLFHEMNIMDTNGGKDPATRQRVATMKAIAAAGYFQHERVYKDEYDGRFKKTTALLVSCEPKIQATNDPNWDGGDSATRSRHMVKRIKKIELIPEKNVFTKEDANMGKYYERQKVQALNKKKHLDAVICHWQWLLNDVGVLDNITCFVFPYVHKHIMKKGDKTITSKVSSRGLTRVKVLTLNLVKLQAWEILFSYKPPFKRFVFTINDTKRDKVFTLDESEEENKDIVNEILMPNTQQTRWTSADGTKYIFDKVQTLGSKIFVLKEENLENNTVSVVGRWSFDTKYKNNDYNLSDDMPDSHVPLVGKYFGVSYNHILKDSQLQKTFRDDLDSLLYDDTASVIGAFSIGECNFYSYMSSAVLDAFVELTLQKLSKTQQKYLEENETKNYMYIHIGHSNGTQFFENIKEIVSKKSIETQGKKINLSELDFKMNIAELKKNSSKQKKWRRATRVQKIRSEDSNSITYRWPHLDECLRQESVTINNTNQQTLRSSIPLTEQELNEESQYNLLRRVKSKGSMDFDYYFLVPFCRQWATRNTKEDNTTITGTLKTFSHKYAKPKYVATGNGTKMDKTMFPEIGELLFLKPNNEVIVDKQPNVITPAAAKILGCNGSLAQQKTSSVFHDIDDLSCLERQAQLFKIPKPSLLTRSQIDDALQLPIVKRANKTYLMELVHASKLQIDPNVYQITGKDWFSSAINEALTSFKSNNIDQDTSGEAITQHENVIHVDETIYEATEEKTSEDRCSNENNILDQLQNEQMQRHITFSEQDMQEVRRAFELAQEQEQQDENCNSHMMMRPSITEEEANEQKTVSLNELGVLQIGTDSEEISCALIDNEAGQELPPQKRQKTQNILEEDEDDDY